MPNAPNNKVESDSSLPCPICDAPAAKILGRDEHTVLVKHGAGLRLAPHRHVMRWRDLTGDEQMALTARIASAQDWLEGQLENGGGISRVMLFEKTGAHLHLRVDPPLDATISTPSLPHGGPLVSGGEDALLEHLLPWIDKARAIDMSVAFLSQRGANLVKDHLSDLLDRGGQLRLLTGDYMHWTEPDALRLMTDLSGDMKLYVFQADCIPFHPKAWMFTFDDEAGALIVGSSNLTHQALTEGVEWNLRYFDYCDAAPLQAARCSFEKLLKRPEVVTITSEWINNYEAIYEKKKTRRPAPPPRKTGESPAPAEKMPEPHVIQIEAMDALKETREKGYGAGLVVLATGLGKTYLAVFDSSSMNAKRVLFVAHRDEILKQAMAAFRKVRPNAHLGRFAGGEKDFDAEVLFASVQTLGREANLGGFERDAFDYIVIDEFHHAAATTYRRIIDHFTPDFLLGLTATPDRNDGQDLLGLCEENLVYECDLWSGIAREQLAPFKYFGVPDLVEYAQIPWRSGRFDENALTEAVATKARAENALDQLSNRGGGKSLGFCVSVRHADFMARFARERGLNAVAVHSGKNSAPRTSSLKELEDGQLDIVFTVDMFNEGVDIPSIDTVLMLRPTESLVIWLQQIGRGLRAFDKKTLTVIDYIGNHRVFLTKARALLRSGIGERKLYMALNFYHEKKIDLPKGCEVTYDLEAFEILKSLIRLPKDSDELAAFYQDFRDRHGVRPTASEMQHAGFNPRRTGHAGWLSFVADMGDMSANEHTSWTTHKDILNEIETTDVTEYGKMLILRSMIDANAFPGRVALSDLAERIMRFARRNPQIKNDFYVASGETDGLPIKLKDCLVSLSETQWFRLDQGAVETTFANEAAGALSVLAAELVDWLIQQHLQYPRDTRKIVDSGQDGITKPPSWTQNNEGLQLWKEYKRKDIAPLFGADFNTASWNTGIVSVNKAKSLILFITMGKGNMSAGNHYEDSFESPTRFVWQTQNQTKRDGKHGKIISGKETGWTVHLFLRKSKMRGNKGGPFRYFGPVSFVKWEGDKPITVTSDLSVAVPQNLKSLYEIKGD